MSALSGNSFVFEKGERSFRARLGALLAAGGSGVVQAGEREATPGTSSPIVVKRAKPGAERLLEVERRAGERLSHPNVIRYLGTARSPEGNLVAFERLATNPVQLLSEPVVRPRFRDPGTPYHPLPPGTALELAFDLACALEYLHGQGLVHGDVKLGNFLIRTPDPAAGARAVLAQVASGSFEGVLIDLGSLRRVVADPSRGAGRAPAVSSLEPSITPLYAPPEALLENARGGNQIAFTPAMDVYAFGFVLYVLLTGHLPYERYCEAHEARHPTVLDELKLREARGDLQPLDLTALDDVPLHDVAFVGGARTGWPIFRSRTEDLLLRCIAPDPARRPSATEVRGFLERELRLRPAEAGSPRRWTQGLFKMRPLSNRLTGDAPLGGIVVRLEGSDAVGEELSASTPRMVPAMPTIMLADESGDGFTDVARRAPSGPLPVVRTSSGLALLAHLPSGPALLARLPSEPLVLARVESEPARPALRPVVPLLEALVRYRADGVLPVRGPVLVTSASLEPFDLLRGRVVSLEEHVRWHGARRIVLGRGEACDLPLLEPQISREHCALERSNGSWTLVDLRSSNGTWVDGKRVASGRRVLLGPGFAAIRVGHMRVSFLEERELGAFLDQALAALSHVAAPGARPCVLRREHAA